jgi:hypothetical protein
MYIRCMYNILFIVLPPLHPPFVTAQQSKQAVNDVCVKINVMTSGGGGGRWGGTRCLRGPAEEEFVVALFENAFLFTWVCKIPWQCIFMVYCIRST